MSDLTQYTHRLLHWYTERARPFLAEFAPPEKVAAFDTEHTRLAARHTNLNTELAVCFLGSSGVGKSTLLNAMVDPQQTLVPAGGVGPLTAQAIEVRYAPQPRLEILYHGVGILHKTYFGLTQMFKAELGQMVEEPMPEGLDETDLPDIAPAITAEAEATSARNEAREQWRRRAQLLVTGDQAQVRDIKYLIDSLRQAAGKPRLWQTTSLADDEKRLMRIQQVLQLAQAQPGQPLALDGAHGSFQQAVRDHAVGYMAPLLKHLTIYWPAPLLQQGLTLVDLPGVGILRDAHKEVTRRWIREKARALVLVVDHRGITESVAHALRETEFLNTLLYGVDQLDENPVVLVAVTRIDDLAHSRYEQDTAQPKRKKYEHFLEVSAEVRERLRHDLQTQLTDLWLSDAEATEARRAVTKNLLDNLQVHPLSAPEYTRILLDDEDNRPFIIREAQQSGFPRFVKSLEQLATQRQQRLWGQLNEHTRFFRANVLAALSLLEAQWQEQTRAKAEAEKLREELTRFLAPQREALRARQGAYREFLRNTIPTRIKDLVTTASHTAQQEIERYLKRLGNAHWTTLRASVRRGGAYRGATEIDLPNVFALKVEEPIAAAWGQEILRDLRARTKEYGQDCVALAGALTEWASAQGVRVQLKAVQAQYAALQANAKKFEAVGREMTQDMRSEARAQLVGILEKPIRAACKKFVEQNQDVGAGVKSRILELYQRLAAEVATTTRPPAQRLLQKVYTAAQDEMEAELKAFNDPLTPLAEAIINTQEARLVREDTRRREEVLARLSEVQAALPAEVLPAGLPAPQGQ